MKISYDRISLNNNDNFTGELRVQVVSTNEDELKFTIREEPENSYNQKLLYPECIKVQTPNKVIWELKFNSQVQRLVNAMQIRQKLFSEHKSYIVS
jgi:hypothetical protein